MSHHRPSRSVPRSANAHALCDAGRLPRAPSHGRLASFRLVRVARSLHRRCQLWYHARRRGELGSTTTAKGRSASLRCGWTDPAGSQSGHVWQHCRGAAGSAGTSATTTADEREPVQDRVRSLWRERSRPAWALVHRRRDERSAAPASAFGHAPCSGRCSSAPSLGYVPCSSRCSHASPSSGGARPGTGACVVWPPTDGCAGAVQHGQCLPSSSWIDTAYHDAAADVFGTAAAVAAPAVLVVPFARGNFVRAAGTFDPTRLGSFRRLWRRRRRGVDVGSAVKPFLCCATADDDGRTAVAGNASATSSATLSGRNEGSNASQTLA